MQPKILCSVLDDNDCESIDLNKYGNQDQWGCSGDLRINSGNSNSETEREYTYDEAIELTGTGWYTYTSLLVLSTSVLAMSIDILSFPTVVSLSSCDFYLTNTQINVLLMIPYAGPAVMAYFWGFASDTQGRWKTLLVSMTVSFAMSILSAFSPNWITLGILKFIGTGFSSCAMSVSFVLLGECCSDRIRNTFLFIMASAMHICVTIYFVLAYVIGNLKFEYDIGIILFVPWRLLVIILALPLGLSALGLTLIYESPKFLLNTGRTDQAVEMLKKICKRNCGVHVYYPVQKIILNEHGNVIEKSNRIITSLWQQTAPLFQPPLVHRTVLLFCLMFIIYGSSSSIRIWLPFFADDFTEAISTSGDDRRGLCTVIAKGEIQGLTDQIECISQIPEHTVIFGVCIGGVFFILNLLISIFPTRKKVLMIIIFVFAGACCICSMHVPNNLVDIIMFFGSMANILCTGIILAYCIDIYPTSHRSMGASLCVLVANVSSIFGIQFIGAYITWHCSRAFFALSALIFCGAILSYLLPSDNVKKQ